MPKEIPTGGNPTTFPFDESDLNEGLTFTIGDKIPRVARIALKKNENGKLELSLGEK
jgi:hypothetical protein